VACACGAHYSECPPYLSSHKFLNLIWCSKISDADKYV
jgi:hypothetical protein